MIKLSRGTTWLDTGTLDGLVEASEWVKVTEETNGYKIAAIDEIAWTNGWITTDQFKVLADNYKNEYGAYLLSLID